MMSLIARRTVSVSLPEFVVRALEYRVAETNEIDVPGRDVEFSDIVEWYLVGAISVRDVAVLEQEMPGFAEAVTTWLQETELNF